METTGDDRRRWQSERVRTPLTYKVCDGLTEILIYFSVLFTPWAFGTTQDWSVWTMNTVCYLLGVLLGAKWLIRWWAGYKPSRWGEAGEIGGFRVEDAKQSTVLCLTRCLAILTVIILAYTFVSALNARATFLPRENRFVYHNYLPWLPHSYDRTATLNIFWQYLGLAFFFWATRDWLLGKTRKERQGITVERRTRSRASVTLASEMRRPELSSEDREVVGTPHSPPLSRSPASPLPARLCRLVWVVCLNGALLALEGVLQRLDGTNKLLWLVMPQINSTNEAQFGPYAYRSNAATYLNLLWPVCLGLWLRLRSASARMRRHFERVGGGSYVVLLPCAVLIASAPIISTSRGGALIALAGVPVASGIVFFSARRERALVRASMLTLFLVILGFSAYLGWKDLARRLETMFSDDLSGRIQIYQNSRRIAEEFPILGTGPASFTAIYQLYKEPNQVWDAYLHDDWLETRVTYGWAGLGAILTMLGLVLGRWCFPSGIAAPWEFVAFIWLGLAGCLVHAKFDFPLQIYSILFLFLLLCSILLCLSRK
ncbi:MAG: O-antigen ligase family protein [Verrucomicrobia bacterium]|nr:O-antigen ligase family protein [Verrucomicrobiota bacterium]